MVMVKFESEKWLEQYARNRSQSDFERLIEEHSGLVKGTALRRLNGDHFAADDVMQEVFVSLSRKASQLVEEGVSVSAWLYRQTCRLSANHVRSASRRRSRESKVRADFLDEGDPNQDEVLEEVDDAMMQLAECERALIISRFVDECDHASLGRQYGVSAEAARKRVSRAVDQLRQILKTRGLGVSTPVLVAAFAGFTGPKATAKVVGGISAKAVLVKVGTGHGILSIPGVLVGGLAMSLVAGGIEAFSRSDGPVMAKSEVMPPVGPMPEPATKDELAMLDPIGKIENGGLSLDEVILELKELEGEPDHLFTNAKIDLLVSSISPDEVANCFKRVDGELSVVLRERLLRALVKRASSTGRLGMADWFFETEFQGEEGAPSWHTDKVLFFRILMEADPRGVSDWFSDHWAEIRELLQKPIISAPGPDGWYRYSQGRSLAAMVARHRFWAFGIKDIDEYLRRFDDETRLVALRGVLTLGRGKYIKGRFVYPIRLYPIELSAYLRTFSKEPFYEELQWACWHAWREGSERNRADLESYLKALPELESEEARAAFEYGKRKAEIKKGEKR